MPMEFTNNSLRIQVVSNCYKRQKVRPRAAKKNKQYEEHDKIFFETRILEMHAYLWTACSDSALSFG